MQRINLTTALGTSLVPTLFVLDEPSIGLHPRDMHRITQAMHRLRDAVGLPLSTYFSGPKIRWLLDNVDGAEQRAENGEVAFGNMDTGVPWNRNGGTSGGGNGGGGGCGRSQGDCKVFRR